MIGWLFLALSASQVVLHDTDVVHDPTWVRGAPATVRVSVWGATDLANRTPIAGASVTLSLGAEDAQLQPVATTKTSTDGTAVLRFRVPELEAGRYRVELHTQSIHGEQRVLERVRITDRAILRLRTDRRVYRAGERIRWAASLLGGVDSRPIAGAPITVTAKEPGGLVVWSESIESPAGGFLVGEVPLGDDLRLGTYTLEASARGASTTERVEVRAIRLPAFEVSIALDDAANERAPLTGAVIARYAYGEPVAGRARASLGGAQVEGELDANGRLAFSFPRPDRDEVISARITDGAQRTETASIRFVAPSGSIAVAIIPDADPFPSPQGAGFTVITTDADGALLPAQIRLKGIPGAPVTIDSPGARHVALGPLSPNARLSVQARARAGSARGEATRELRVALATRFVRAANPIIESGAPIHLQGVWDVALEPISVTVLRDGVPIASGHARSDADRRFSLSVTLPPSTFGLVTVRAGDLRWNPSSRRMEGGYVDHTVYLRPRTLDLALTAPTRHAPGANATIEASLTERGRPVAGATLLTSAVDTRALALGPGIPDLVSVLRRASAADARAAGLHFVDQIARGDAASLAAAAAILATVRPTASRPSVHNSAADRFRAEVQRAHSIINAAVDAFSKSSEPVVEISGREWRLKREVQDLLQESSGVNPLTPWREVTTWSYVESVIPELANARAVTARVGSQRADRLLTILNERAADAKRGAKNRRVGDVRDLLSAIGAPRLLGYDAFGHALRYERRSGDLDVCSPGPDGVHHNEDDQCWSSVLSTVGYGGLGSRGMGAGGGGFAMGSVGLGAHSSAGRGDPPLRSRFEETLLFAAGPVTAADGLTRFSVPLGDSITAWQIDVEAISPEGGVAAARARLETFQPLFVDAMLPEAFTTGDVYAAPIVVTNHELHARSLVARVRASGALSILDGAPTEVSLVVPPGEARSARIQLAAVGRGTGELSLELSDERGLVDRVVRKTRVDPPKEPVLLASAAQLDGGEARFQWEVPEDAYLDTVHARLRLFRGPADQAMDGLEGLLQEPHGCFEQTSSSTHPNLLVLMLLKDAPEVAALRTRARDLVAKGYQRLISYEVPGGGFSWFGEAPANQVLSAYGLLELTDLSKVYPVDVRLLDRTAKWIESKQKENGSWSPDPSWLHDWSVVQGAVSTTAYVAWALAESGRKGRSLDRALRFLAANERELVEQPYLLALWAAAAHAAGRPHGRMVELLSRYEARVDGLSYSAKGATLFYARGKSADVQVTALAAAALSASGRSQDAKQALAWLWSARDSRGGWGSTQSTVLALRASAALAKPAPTEGMVDVLLDGRSVGKIDLSTAGEVPSLALDTALASGAHTVSLTGGTGGVQAELRHGFRTRGMPGPIAEGLSVTLEKRGEEPWVGGRVEMTLKIDNPSDQVVPMPTAIVPVPPGFSVDREHLESLVVSKAAARFELVGDRIHLYWTELAAGGSLSITYRLDAEAECRVMQRPASAYAYYDRATAGASAPFMVETVRRGELAHR